jgi:hypothetical protein
MLRVAFRVVADAVKLAEKVSHVLVTPKLVLHRRVPPSTVRSALTLGEAALARAVELEPAAFSTRRSEYSFPASSTIAEPKLMAESKPSK